MKLRPPTAPPVFMFHSVSPSQEEDPYLLRVSPARLARQLEHLQSRGIRGVSMRELATASAAGRTRRLVGLTFDDGYADFLSEAVPVLDRYGMTATVFVIAGRLGGSNEWDAEGPRLPLMTAAEVRAVDEAGHEVGSHGYTHVPLAGLSPDELSREVVGSREALEDVLGHQISGFCYPYGSFDDRAVGAVRAAGYDYGCVTNDYGHPDRHSLPRFYVGERDDALRLRVKTARHRLRVRAGGLRR
jgi:peptidoglycan/xylan/chitin deacetylase (PgdA/CDA1 family)